MSLIIFQKFRRWSICGHHVAENKRKCATILMNHLIVMGAMTIDCQKGNKFEEYVNSLNAANAARGNFTVHNATKVEIWFLSKK